MASAHANIKRGDTVRLSDGRLAIVRGCANSGGLHVGGIHPVDRLSVTPLGRTGQTCPDCDGAGGGQSPSHREYRTCERCAGAGAILPTLADKQQGSTETPSKRTQSVLKVLGMRHLW